MKTTQDHLSIAEIKDGIVFLKKGGAALVLQVSAVNFGLLSEREQVAIISAFAHMLNSLSFSIQIVIHSERLNISSYLKLLDTAQKIQTNPLLASMMAQYRQFIQTVIKENEVLDKKFYIIIPLYELEVGLSHSKEALAQKVKTILLPRHDQVVRQLQRVGLKAAQLDTNKLLELFFDLYNGTVPEEVTLPDVKLGTVKLGEPQIKKPAVTVPEIPPAPPKKEVPISSQPSKTHPFVVEELEG